MKKNIFNISKAKKRSEKILKKEKRTLYGRFTIDIYERCKEYSPKGTF